MRRLCHGGASITSKAINYMKPDLLVLKIYRRGLLLLSFMYNEFPSATDYTGTFHLSVKKVRIKMTFITCIILIVIICLAHNDW